ncbi:glycosyltransferase [Ideonella oryzae]|uniref:Glycosyltransferase n=1 Tax=Ideonella oryzae TaxID=2937441 RepID=A0ABT1BSI6_9BURK|nr:glycosyltransferase [Ideonella oryzae]MCO5978889.1 glycosyltransferase [Ideonella oryzae]
MPKMQERPRLLLVAPYVDEPAMLQALSQGLDVEVQTELFRTSRSVAASTFRRHWNIFRSAWAAFRQRDRVGYIVFGEQFIGLYYALLTRLLGRGKRGGPRTIVLQLIYNRRPGWKGEVYRTLYAWLIRSPALTRLACAASIERRYYAEEFGAVVADKLVFIPFGRNSPLGTEARREPVAAPDESPFFFAGGTSNRDYKTLIEAFRGLSAELQIACYPSDVADLNIPPNVVVLHGVFDDEFKRKVRDCTAMIIPIKNTDVSAGQLVLLDAMRLGKACIVTAGGCMEDYVDEKSAICVSAGDSDAIRRAVRDLVCNPRLVIELGEAARLRYEKRNTRAAFGRAVAASLKG